MTARLCEPYWSAALEETRRRHPSGFGEYPVPKFETLKSASDICGPSAPNPKDSEGTPMSAPTPPPETHAPDATEAIVPMIPLVLPLVGGVLMFLLAFIAIYMA